MLIDKTLLENYIAANLPAPGDLIFISDGSAIFPQDGTLNILNRVYPIVFFENVLQLRDTLEKYKDNLNGKLFCIVSQKSEEEEIAVLDYVFRSDYLKVTPKDILAFAQNGYQWTNEVNQLHGRDFWEAFEPLTQFRLKLERKISPTDCANVVLSALLGVDLTGEISNRDAIELWRGLDEGDNLMFSSQFLISDENENLISEKYPGLWRILSRRVRATIPMMAKLDGDADFVCFLWTMNSVDKHCGNYELFLPHIFGDRIWHKYANTPISDIKQFCSELIRNDPRRVIEQIKQTEFWLTQDAERLRLFNSCVGIDEIDLQKTAEFAATERTFCVPMQEALGSLAKRLCLSPDLLDPRLVDYVLHNIKRKHLFIQDDTTYLRIRDTFEAFAKLIQLSQILTDIEGKNWLREDDIQLRFSLWNEIYPQYFSKLEYLIDRFELLNFRCNLLPEALVKQIVAKVDKLFATYNEAFARLIQSRYIHWVSSELRLAPAGQNRRLLSQSSAEKEPSRRLTGLSRQTRIAKDTPLLTTDFLDTIFMPCYEEYIRTPKQSAFIILFDGMRWDGWNAIKTSMLQTFGGKLALDKTVPLLAILPTTTAYSRRAIISSLFPNESIRPLSSETGEDESGNFEDWRELLSFAFAKRLSDEVADCEAEVDDVQAITVHEQNLSQLVQLIEDSEVKVKVINFNLFDHKLHASKQNLSTLYEEVLVNFDDIIQPCLERIPPDSLVFILSDHGAIEIRGKAQSIHLATAGSKERYFGLQSAAQYSDIPDNIIALDADDIKMPRNSGIVQYGFATSNMYFSTKDVLASTEGIVSYSENRGETFVSQAGRYVHGGISMQEMIIPCAIFVPKGEGQLELWTKVQNV